jgi:hypothetical protein
MFIIYRENSFRDVCETQLNRMKALEPESVELVISRDGNYLNTNKGNRYIISKSTAKRVRGHDETDSESNEHRDKSDG